MRSEGISIVDAITAKAVPNKLAQAILDIDGECECGEPLEFDASMREIRCSSINCIHKLIGEAKLALMFLGANEDEVNALESDIHAELSNSSKCGCEILLSENERIKEIVEKYVNDEMQLGEILGLTGIKLLSQSSESIMVGYRSVKELYDDIDKNDMVTLVRKLYLEKGIIIASKLKYDIERCRAVLLEVERMLNIKVKASKAKKIAGKNISTEEFIGVATNESADMVGEYTNSKLFGTVVKAVNEKRARKGLSALQRL